MRPTHPSSRLGLIHRAPNLHQRSDEPPPLHLCIRIQPGCPRDCRPPRWTRGRAPSYDAPLPRRDPSGRRNAAPPPPLLRPDPKRAHGAAPASSALDPWSPLCHKRPPLLCRELGPTITQPHAGAFLLQGPDAGARYILPFSILLTSPRPLTSNASSGHRRHRRARGSSVPVLNLHKNARYRQSQERAMMFNGDWDAHAVQKEISCFLLDFGWRSDASCGPTAVRIAVHPSS
ncbi:serine/arginine repetitive matrix protein 1-like [Triticum dicoccoides]|uniref:serine/arginine repetitive matrix protein 1-like n=1 Tax=Triticum dicoccoides TaxID=85692 RepID=UPI00188FC239|nr:serine/arginine repetitive matrix protein 1-like [Triticum dicoccoides]